MAGEDDHYAGWVRLQTCAGNGCEKVAGQIHHPRINVGAGLRGHDHTGIPLCGSGSHGCHGSLHNPIQTGPFKGWGRNHRQVWEAKMAQYYRGRYLDTMAEYARDAVCEEVF